MPRKAAKNLIGTARGGRPGDDLRTANLRKRRTERRVRNTRTAIQRNIDHGRQIEEELAEIKASPELNERVLLEVEKKKAEFLTSEEKAIIVELFALGMSRKRIAAAIHRETSTVVNFLARYNSTTRISRMYFEANADKLARRVVRQADVAESLEVLDRLDVLSKKRDDRSSGGPQFNVFVGMPGAQSSAPVPTPAQIVEAQVVSKE